MITDDRLIKSLELLDEVLKNTTNEDLKAEFEKYGSYGPTVSEFLKNNKQRIIKMNSTKKNIISTNLKSCTYEDFKEIIKEIENTDNYMKLENEIFDKMCEEKEYNETIKQELNISENTDEDSSEFVDYLYKKFYPGRRFYTIQNNKIKEHIIQSGTSMREAEAISKIYVIYDEWSEANKVLTKYNKL